MMDILIHETGGGKMRLKCERCGAEVDQEDSYELGNERVCEDCYFDSNVSQHDPIAQSTAEKFSEVFVEVKSEELLEEQRKVHEFIKEKEKVTNMEILQKFGMSEGDLSQILIVLGGLKLVKDIRINGEVCHVPWEYGGTQLDPAKKKEEWLAKIKKEGKLKDPKEGHSIALRTMQNRTRREILAFIEDGKRLKTIQEVFNLSESAAKFHLDMLENAFYIEKMTKEGDIYYHLTLLGEEYLENVEKQR